MPRSRTHRIAFRVSRHELDLITWAAFNQGLTLSEFIRTAALERAGQVLIDVSAEKESA